MSKTRDALLELFDAIHDADNTARFTAAVAEAERIRENPEPFVLDRKAVDNLVRTFYRVVLGPEHYPKTANIDVILSGEALRRAVQSGNSDDVLDACGRNSDVCIVGGDFTPCHCTTMADVLAFLMWSVTARGPYRDYLSREFWNNAQHIRAIETTPIVN